MKNLKLPCVVGDTVPGYILYSIHNMIVILNIILLLYYDLSGGDYEYKESNSFINTNNN